MIRIIAAWILAVAATTSVAVFTGPASAANDHTLPDPETFPVENPCTDELTDLTITYTKSVFHLSEDAQGGIHVTGTLVADVETDDGFSGRFTVWFGGNDGVGGGDNANFTETFSFTLMNGEGQVVVVHGVSHVTFVDGEAVIEFSAENAECRGKPAA